MLTFSYDFGSYHGGYWSYEIKEENGVLKFKAKGRNGVKLNLTSTIEDIEIQELITIIKKYNLAEWNNFHQSNPDIIDGYEFNLKYIYEKEIVNAYGYMEYPKKYKEGHAEITSFFDKLVHKKETQ